MRSEAHGFTLIELVVGITAMAFALVLLSTLVFPLATQSVDPVHQVRAAELGQSLMAEILSKAYDENSDFDGGWSRCGEQDRDGNTIDCIGVTGPDSGRSPDEYNNVGDYHQDDFQPAGSQYPGFDKKITITCIPADTCDQAKQVDLSIKTPTGDTIIFSALRYNW